MTSHSQKLESYIALVADRFVEGRAEVMDALRLIKTRCPVGRKTEPLQLLALRRYLRMGGLRVHAQWAWTPEQQQRLSQSGSAKLLMDAARKVQLNFAARNPGCSLVISPLRSLESQVEKWDKNDTVSQAGQRLVSEMERVLATPEFPYPPTSTAAVVFSHKLRAAHVHPEPSSAAPGTSDHGQGRAVDFVVRNGQRTVADTKTAQITAIWKAGGWEKKLIAAAQGTRLAGPLQHPYEPWHWWLGTAAGTVRAAG
jgi:hypothetical protein